MFIDTHCHIYKEYYDNIEEIVNEMENNIIIVSGCDTESNKEVLELVKKHKNVYGTIGLHPEYADSVNIYDFKFLKENINNDKIVGIGEIGLDYYYGSENKELQKEIFKKQLDIAIKHNKTIVIHSRDAIKDTVDIINEKKLQDHKIVFHCFSSSVEIAKKLTKNNTMLGIGGVVTFKNSQKLKEVVENIDLNKLVLETDSPYLTPEPFRGQTNKPSYSLFVAEKIAEIKQISLEEVLEVTTSNAVRQFDLKI